MRRNPSILQNNVLGINNKPLEYRIYSFVKLIWGIFILVRLRTLAVKKSYKLVENHLNIPGENFGMFNAVKTVEHDIARISGLEMEKLYSLLLFTCLLFIPGIYDTIIIAIK
jgi:hypothetical protein